MAYPRRFATAGVAAVSAAALLLWLPRASAQESNMYDQQLRPQFHFSPAASFTNDPNGLVYYKGRYHLFYQQRVFSGETGLSCCDWGHATSTDLVRWAQRPVAIARVPASPSMPEEAIFSGSAVVDWRNTSGFGTPGNPPLVAIYTGARPGSQTQKLAFSVDAGETWQIYPGNPVLDIQSGAFRDPKVFWHEPLQRWTMVIYSSTGTRFYTSPNLKEWTYRSTFGTGFECPDFFPLLVDGDQNKVKWVLFEANGSYWVGDFDGSAFMPDDSAPSGRMDHGTNYYAAQTFSDTPGRRISIGWISTGFARRGIWTELPWMGAMTVARELSLRTIDRRPQLVTTPVQELASLRTAGVTVSNRVIHPDSSAALDPGANGDQLDIEITIDPGSAAQSGLRLLASQGLYTTVGYDAGTNEVYIDRSRAGRQDGLAGNGSTGRAALPAETKGKPVTLRVLVDRSTLEVYADGGARVLSANVMPLVNTTMTSAARAGNRTILVRSTTGFATGQTVRVNADANGPLPGMRTYPVAAVGTGLIRTSLAATVRPGDETLRVTDTANFAAGRTVTVGSGTSSETFTVATEGVGTPASTATRLLADITAGATNINVASVAGFTPGALVSIDTGEGVEMIPVAAGGVGTAGRATTLASDGAPGATSIKVATVMGALVGTPVVIGSGTAGAETRTIMGPVGVDGRFNGTAGAEGTGIILSAPISTARDAGTPVRFLGSGVTLASPVTRAHLAGAAVRSLGSGIRVTTPARRSHAQDALVADPGTGLTLASPLASGWEAGTPISTAPGRKLEAFAADGTAQIIVARVWRMRSIWTDPAGSRR
jgi:fructan beta-fructosidase